MTRNMPGERQSVSKQHAPRCSYSGLRPWQDRKHSWSSNGKMMENMKIHAFHTKLLAFHHFPDFPAPKGEIWRPSLKVISSTHTPKCARGLTSSPTGSPSPGAAPRPPGRAPPGGCRSSSAPERTPVHVTHGSSGTLLGDLLSICDVLLPSVELQVLHVRCQEKDPDSVNASTL